MRARGGIGEPPLVEGMVCDGGFLGFWIENCLHRQCPWSHQETEESGRSYEIKITLSNKGGGGGNKDLV